MAELLQPVCTVRCGEDESISFYCPNAMALWRARSFYEKEPETIQWIKGFQPGEKLLDVGANVGIYTLFAAKLGHPVVALEPESQNYAVLNHNVFLNRVDDKVLAFNIALADANEASVLFVSKFGIGNALHSVQEEVDYRHKRMKADFRQGVTLVTLDCFLEDQCANFFPDHVKIDVDGAESKIIKGGMRAIRDPRLKSVLIEINEELECDRTIIEIMKECGFPRFSRQHSSLFETGSFSKSFNYIFTR